LAERQERLGLSEKERDRLKVLHEVVTGGLRQHQGAAQCGISERGFRKLLKRYRQKGDWAVAHALRGCASNRRLDEETAQKAIGAIERRYRDFGPALAAEYLARDANICISRETVRKLMMRAGLWQASPRKLRQVHMWRPRRSCRGELVQWDTSVHAWLEDRGPDKMYLSEEDG
jgi:transposase